MKTSVNMSHFIDCITKSSYQTISNPSGDMFKVNFIEESVMKARKELEEERSVLLTELQKNNQEIVLKRDSFQKNLNEITSKLESARNRSIELSRMTNQLTVDFAKITEQLDSATSFVNRAEGVSRIIQYIIIFNTQDSIDSIRSSLSNSDFPVDSYLDSSEFIAKLMKSVNSIVSNDKGSSHDLSKAITNLNEYSRSLSSNLLNLFMSHGLSYNNGKYVCNHKYRSENADYVKALMLLNNGEDALKKYISLFPLIYNQRGLTLYCSNIETMPINRINDNFNSLCSEFEQNCRDLWEEMDILFDRSLQAKLKLQQEVISSIFKIFVKKYLDMISSNHPDQFCVTLSSLYQKASNTMKGIWEIDKQPYSTTNILDDAFMEYQKRYSAQELQKLATIENKEIYPKIKEILQYFDNEKKWNPLLNKPNANIDVFKYFEEECIIAMLNATTNACERASIVCPQESISAVLKAILDLFIERTLREYIIEFIRVCIVQMKKDTEKKYTEKKISDKKDEDSYAFSSVNKFFNIIASLSGIINTFDDKYENKLKPILMPLSKTHADFLSEKSKLVDSLENRIVEGLDVCISIILKYVSDVLSSKEAVNTYVISKSNIDNRSNSPICIDFVKHFLCKGGVVEKMNQFLGGENLGSFSSVLATRVFDEFLKHVFEYKFTFQEGTILFSLDLGEYSKVFEKLDKEILKSKLEDLFIAAKINQNSPDSIIDVVKTLSPSANALEWARKLVSKRSDFKQNKVLNMI